MSTEEETLQAKYADLFGLLEKQIELLQGDLKLVRNKCSQMTKERDKYHNAYHFAFQMAEQTRDNNKKLLEERKLLVEVLTVAEELCKQAIPVRRHARIPIGGAFALTDAVKNCSHINRELIT